MTLEISFSNKNLTETKKFALMCDSIEYDPTDSNSAHPNYVKTCGLHIMH